MHLKAVVHITIIIILSLAIHKFNDVAKCDITDIEVGIATLCFCLKTKIIMWFVSSEVMMAQQPIIDEYTKILHIIHMQVPLAKEEYMVNDNYLRAKE